MHDLRTYDAAVIGDGLAGLTAIERELEDWLESIQPGWRIELVERRYLPKMRVYHALPMASEGGLLGRPGYIVPGANHLYLAGDWVGDEGLLDDAALLTAKRASQSILRRESVERSLAPRASDIDGVVGVVGVDGVVDDLGDVGVVKVGPYS